MADEQHAGPPHPSRRGGRKQTGPQGRAKGRPPNRRLVVGIGASAGGLDALQRFFRALPESNGLVFVVVIHLDPHRESHLAEVLQRSTPMTVIQVTDKTLIESDHVFVIPPNKSLTATDEKLTLSAFDEPRGRRAPIDAFFRTLAETHKENAVAIILSGGGTDGSAGLRSVKDQGGIVMVQAPEDAEHEGMPRSAINTGLADLVLPVEQLAERLLRYRSGGLPLRVPKDGERLPPEQGDILNRLLSLLRARTGHDFTQYKRATVLRRIGRRMRVNQIIGLDDYLNFLRTTPSEAELLQKDMLIGVTHFFRDPEAWTQLAKLVIPKIIESSGEDSGIRVWVPGCATGEEAYSLTILLLELLEPEHRPEIQVFASDLDEEALTFARYGLYPDAIRADVSEERLVRFFEKQGDHFRIKKEVRDRVLFSSHSLFKDPPFSKLHLISCRNLLIYLNRELQQSVFNLFHYALRPGGYLFLGSAEAVEADGGLFEPIDRKHRLYRKLESARKPALPHLELSGRTLIDTDLREVSGLAPISLEEARRHQKLLEEIGPPSIVVQRNHELVHLSQSAGRYLKRPGGLPSDDILREIRPELRLPLQRALHAAFEKHEATSSRPIEVQFNGESGWVHLIVRPRTKTGDEPDLALVVLVEVEQILGASTDEAEPEDHPTVLQLEEELRRLHEQLQNTIEEYESSREEMKASNEELQSIAEEYKSTSEELETSKEELQSVNEELETVNQELKNKVEELSQSNSDLQNLMDSTDVETLFLDRELAIQRFTPGLSEIFHIVPSDRGRPIGHLTHQLEYDAFVADARQVLRNLVPVDREIRRRENGWYLMRLRPYRTVDERIDGVVATFVDITALKKAEEDLREEKEYSDLIVDTVEESLLLLDAEFKVVSANRSFYDRFRVSPDETEGRLVYRFADGQWDFEELRQLLEQRLSGEEIVHGFRVEQDFKRIGRRAVLLNARRIGERQLILLSMEDVTEREKAENALKELNRTLERKIEARSQEIREITLRLAKAEEVEQRRISAVLHDDLQQRIYACQLQIDALRGQIEQGKRTAALGAADEIRAALDDLLNLTRNLSRLLAPPALEKNLLESISWLSEQMAKVYGLRIDLRKEQPFNVLDDGHRVLLFQSIRELLFNVVKHSAVKQATLVLGRSGPRYFIEVQDSGSGFDAERIRRETEQGVHLGLSTIRERLDSMDGELQIESAPGRGTRIRVLLPETLARTSHLDPFPFPESEPERSEGPP